MARHFVTGGAGFIGSHLADRLMSGENRVTVYDNLVSGKMDNLKQHIGKEEFSFVQADLLDFNTLKQAMYEQEVVWHLGANTDIPGGNRVTDLDLKNCTVATHNVLEVMRQNGIRKIVFASGGTVYGEMSERRVSEDAGPLLPISLYGAGKLACEGLISAYCHLSDIQAWILRFGNVVGDRMGHGVIYDFIHKLKRNAKELEILGDGNQEKNYILVEDCIEAMLCAFHSSNDQCNLFNLGSESTIKVSTIAKIVAEESGLREARFKYAGGKRGWPGDVPVVLFELEKMAKLGWKARHTSDEAVRIATKRLLAEDEN